MIATVPTAILALALVGGLATAAWVLLVQDSTTIEIDSSERLGIESTLVTLSLDATGGAATGSETVAVTNTNGDLPCAVSWTLTGVDDDTDTCTDYENDLSVVVEKNSQILNSGDIVTMYSGGNFIEIDYSAVAFACPSDWDMELVVDCS